MKATTLFYSLEGKQMLAMWNSCWRENTNNCVWKVLSPLALPSSPYWWHLGFLIAVCIYVSIGAKALQHTFVYYILLLHVSLCSRSLCNFTTDKLSASQPSLRIVVDTRYNSMSQRSSKVSEPNGKKDKITWFQTLHVFIWDISKWYKTKEIDFKTMFCYQDTKHDNSLSATWGENNIRKITRHIGIDSKDI